MIELGITLCQVINLLIFLKRKKKISKENKMEILIHMLMGSSIAYVQFARNRLEPK
jgi:hypothetical protein